MRIMLKHHNTPSRRHQANGLRSKRGASSFVEVAMSGSLLIVLMFFAIDAYVWIQAYMVNDAACRDACRSAAEAQPSSGATTITAYANAAREAALAQITLHVQNSAYLTNPQLVAINYNYTGTMPPQPQTPTVTVTTSIDVNLPAPIFFMNSMVMDGGGGKVLRLQRTYVYPIINLPPS
ncbi:MAG TPA: hypothetical protein V6D17_13535 [Candidatus Obscuribacterales bacterium]